METITKNIPALALRGLTVFPRMTASFDVEREISVRALGARDGDGAGDLSCHAARAGR